MTTQRHVLRFPATLAGLKDGFRSLAVILDAGRLDPEQRYDVELVFDELVGNIITHARPTGDVTLEIAIDRDVVLTFEEDGEAFDPRAQPVPPLPASLDEARIGGLGLVLVRQICRQIEYVRTPGHHNRTTLVVPGR